MKASASKRKFIIPEIIQTSAMDCGPASLKALLEGFQIHTSYGRLREVCNTDVDGTSIDTIEDVATELGLDAQQIMVPPDFLLMPEAQVLPAIVVVRLPNSATHFVVAWRYHGALIQLMDPAGGRRWLPTQQFVRSLHVHTMRIPAAAWREWAGSEKFSRPMIARLRSLGFNDKAARSHMESALSDSAWHHLAALEAAARMTHVVVKSGSIRRGREAMKVFDTLFENAVQEASGDRKIIPQEYWSVRPAPTTDSEEQLYFRGAVLVQANGKRANTEPSQNAVRPDAQTAHSARLAASTTDPAGRPGRQLLQLVRRQGMHVPLSVLIALVASSIGILTEATLYRAILGVPVQLGLLGQRVGSVAAILVLLTSLLLLEIPIVSGLFRIGRHLEAHLRIVFLEKIPLLGDRYFHSRLTSDMADRSHNIQRIRQLPFLGGRLIRSVTDILITAAAIVWLDSSLAMAVGAAVVVLIALPLVMLPFLSERDLRFRTHSGALGRFYLDGLLGLVSIRVHRAERALTSEFRSLLEHWSEAGLSRQRAVVVLQGVQSVAGFGLVVWMLFSHFNVSGDSAEALLLVYWALHLPVIGQDLAQLIWQYPTHRNITLRLLEPIGARDDVGSIASDDEDSSKSAGAGTEIRFEKVTVEAGGHVILGGIDLNIPSGSHVAIVGQSGAGKSSLVGVLLGWNRPASGKVWVDSIALEGGRLERLRSETAWVDPSVQIWNRTLFENLSYGASSKAPQLFDNILNRAALIDVLERLPAGMQTRLGEGGGLVSGGEGQRVRIGRAMMRTKARLVILDEPFRGLDRKMRSSLFTEVRAHWRQSTVLCVTHDLRETLAFDRVLIMREGKIIEDGSPEGLQSNPESQYARMLAAERLLESELWESDIWRRVQLVSGKLCGSASKESA